MDKPESFEVVLKKVQEELVKREVPIPGWKAPPEEMDRFSAIIARIVLEEGLIPGERAVKEAEKLARMIAGLGLLEEYISSDGVEEVIVRGGFVLVERDGRVEALGMKAPDSYFELLARRASDLSGRAIRGNKPYVLTDLRGGERFTALVPPLSVHGTAINIRVFKKRAFSIQDFSPPPQEEVEKVEEEAKLPFAPAAFLAEVVRNNMASILIAGAFSTGKTTLLNTLTSLIPPSLLPACIETFKELQVGHPYPVRAVVPETGQEENFPSMREVVNIVYTRMRPDVIVFGEVVGEEAVSLLEAMNLGKKVLTTIHGDTPYDALHRLEMAALSSGLPLQAIKERIGRGINLIIQMRRRGKHRYISSISCLKGYDPKRDEYNLVVLYRSEREVPTYQQIEEIWRRFSPS